ncbi:transposase [Mesorhizobium sp. M0859]
MSDSMSHHRTFEILTAEPVPSRRKPRHRSDEEKARVVAEAFSPGGSVSAVARSEGLDPSQLYAWRRKALSSGMVAPLTEGASKPAKFTRFEAMGSDMVEIIIGDAVVAPAAMLIPIAWRGSSARFARHDRFRCGGLRVVPAGRLPQGRGIFDGAGQGWRPGPVLGGASRIPFEACGPGSHRVVGRQRGLSLFEDSGRSQLLLVCDIGRAHASRPRPVDGASGRTGLEKDPSRVRRPLSTGLKPACGKMNHAAGTVGKAAVFVLCCLPWFYRVLPFPTTLMR